VTTLIATRLLPGGVWPRVRPFVLAGVAGLAVLLLAMLAISFLR
jgi:hypothetical protein